mmetsp:Transcript_176057/g.559299  ORF Transcript_176057/g.559299 Transcript_176057/m.559299 type:complete len:272 (+) Transcript_176057:689-1504(+)
MVSIPPQKHGSSHSRHHSSSQQSSLELPNLGPLDLSEGEYLPRERFVGRRFGGPAKSRFATLPPADFAKFASEPVPSPTSPTQRFMPTKFMSEPFTALQRDALWDDQKKTVLGRISLHGFHGSRRSSTSGSAQVSSSGAVHPCEEDYPGRERFVVSRYGGPLSSPCALHVMPAETEESQKIAPGPASSTQTSPSTTSASELCDRLGSGNTLRDDQKKIALGSVPPKVPKAHHSSRNSSLQRGSSQLSSLHVDDLPRLVLVGSRRGGPESSG